MPELNLDKYTEISCGEEIDTMQSKFVITLQGVGPQEYTVIKMKIVPPFFNTFLTRKVLKIF